MRTLTIGPYLDPDGEPIPFRAAFRYSRELDRVDGGTVWRQVQSQGSNPDGTSTIALYTTSDPLLTSASHGHTVQLWLLIGDCNSVKREHNLTIPDGSEPISLREVLALVPPVPEEITQSEADIFRAWVSEQMSSVLMQPARVFTESEGIITMTEAPSSSGSE